MDKKREIYSDVLKIVSIFMVILIHILSPYREMYYPQNGKFFLLLSIIDDFTRVAVPIFFMITGTFMLSKKTEKYTQFPLFDSKARKKHYVFTGSLASERLGAGSAIRMFQEWRLLLPDC